MVTLMSTIPLSPDKTPVPSQDGVDHINVYSKGHTPLGRDLSNFAHLPFNHPQYGFFASMEAYWYWNGTGRKENSLRRLYGATAKTAGVRLLMVPLQEEAFRQAIEDGLRLKITQNHKLREALKNTTLPLRHYFVYGNNPPVVRESKKHLWQMQCLESIRETLKQGVLPQLSDGTSSEITVIRELTEDPTPLDFALPSN